MRATRNLAEAEMIWQGESEETVRREMQAARADEELTLTTDLKEKVATVEGQWTEALGSQIQGLRERVKDQLLAEDGWEDLEQLEQE
jgi:SpoVK/Ycf46/Vps4 family AAA+-type ATPase